MTIDETFGRDSLYRWGIQIQLDGSLNLKVSVPGVEAFSIGCSRFSHPGILSDNRSPVSRTIGVTDPDRKKYRPGEYSPLGPSGTLRISPESADVRIKTNPFAAAGFVFILYSDL
jgi:hypothetical protein